MGVSNPKFPLDSNGDVSFSPKFRQQEFPALKEACLLKPGKRKFWPTFDSEDWMFKYTTRRKDFPFDKVADEALKIKFTPI